MEMDGNHPTHLIEKIVRQRVYESRYWKEHCFGLTAETLVDKAVNLKFYGGIGSENARPTPFLCLLVKMLQMRPEMEIVEELIATEEFKYVRVLGCFYLRLVGSPRDVYTNLEPLYSDYRKIRYQTRTGWVVTHMDEFIDELLRETHVCDIALPRLPKRRLLEDTNVLNGPRKSLLDNELGLSRTNNDQDDKAESSSLSSDSVSSESEENETSDEEDEAMDIMEQRWNEDEKKRKAKEAPQNDDDSREHPPRKKRKHHSSSSSRKKDKKKKKKFIVGLKMK